LVSPKLVQTMFKCVNSIVRNDVIRQTILHGDYPVSRGYASH